MLNSTIPSAFLRRLEMELVTNANDPLLIALTALRLIFTALWIVVSAVFARILLRRKVFHANVQFLLIALPSSYAVIIVPNTIIQASTRFNISISSQTEITLHEITDIGLFGTTFNLFAFVFERLIATLLVDRYEYISSRIPLISMAMVFAQWSFAALVIALRYAGLLALPPLLAIVGVEWAMSVVMFSALPAISRRAYEKSMRNSDRRYRNRYQSIENIRTAIVLRRLVLFLSMCIIFLLTYYTAMSYWMPAQWFAALEQCFHVLSALLPSVACFIVLLNHEALRNDLRYLLRIGYRNRRIQTEVTLSSSGVPENQIQSISGVNLIIPIEGHRNHYFASYQQQWN